MSLATVTIHDSQFPGRVRRQLVESLRRREIPQKFHYDTLKQAQKWLALHEALSPARTDASCPAAYDRAFERAAEMLTDVGAHVISLGCGGGEKDARLLELLSRGGLKPAYTPVDVSVPMVLAAREAVLRVVSPERCSPVVCDLPAVPDWEEFLPERDRELPRLITFLGMMPTLSPADALPQLSRLVRRQDQLLASANLAPGPHYAEGAARVLPQYDNALTRDWLMTFLVEAGFDSTDGGLVFTVEENPTGSGLLRVQGTFHLERERRIHLDSQTLQFTPGEGIRLFFSYRHTPDLIRQLLGACGLEIVDQWLSASGEEGVFLARRTARECV